MRLRWPRGFGTRLALLVAVAVVAAHLVAALVVVAITERRERPPPFMALGELSATIRLLDAAAPGDRPALLAAAPVAGLILHTAGEGAAEPEIEGRARMLGGLLGPGYPILRVEGGRHHARRFGVRLGDGTLVTFPGRAGADPPDRRQPLLTSAILIATVMAAVSVFAVRTVTRPLERLAERVGGIGLDGTGLPLDTTGPAELTRLAGAINAMRDRIRGLVEDRTRTLAAIGHDLRTPITRLRLRAEDVADEGLRRQVLADLALMERMVTSALGFLSARGAPEPALAPQNLAALLQTLADEAADTGAAVTYVGPARFILTCDGDLVARAAGNLIDNAVKYGGGAAVRLSADADFATIAVEDDGPGIPEAELAEVTEPFRRGDAARTMGARSGFGLGLSIAREVAEAHGGRLLLANRPEGGLVARLLLARRPAQKAGDSLRDPR